MNREDDDIPTADYTIMMKDGRPVRLVDMPDHLLKKVAHKHLRTLRREVLALCVIKKELENRNYQGSLEHLVSYREYNVVSLAAKNPMFTRTADAYALTTPALIACFQTSHGRKRGAACITSTKRHFVAFQT